MITLSPIAPGRLTHRSVCHSQGGFIFPLFFAGASLGHALLSFIDKIFAPGQVAASPVLLCMCFAAGLNVAVTRTPFASPLILTCLSGQPTVMTPALCAALASLFVTRSSKFIGSQRDRADLQFVDDLQPLEKPLSLSASSVSTGFEADLSDGSGVAGQDAEMGSLLTGKGFATDYSAMTEESTER